MASSTALNLEAITRAMDQHDATCPAPLQRIEMAPYEVERLGFDEIRGVPVVERPMMQTGRFRLICGEPEGEVAEEAVTEAVAA